MEDPIELIPAEEAEKSAAEAQRKQKDSFLILAQTGDAMASHPNRNSTAIGKYIGELPKPGSRKVPQTLKPSNRKAFTFDSW